MKNLIPWRVRNYFNKRKQAFTFDRAFREFLNDPESILTPAGSRIAQDLVFGWGNASWSADHEYLVECVKHGLDATGAVLECGSGLTTVLLGAVANLREFEIITLENSSEWAETVQGCLDKYQLNRVRICSSPLKNYGEYTWYDPPWDSLPECFALVVCDGPPGETPGGRSGLVPLMRTRLAPDCVILLDDTNRQEEQAVAELWSKELSATAVPLGQHGQFMKLTLKPS